VKIPPRTVTDQYLARMNEHLDVVFDVDLGELVRGHHVVARGIMLEDRLTEPELHYEFVPALAGQGGFDWYWMLEVTDDAGTEYSDNNGGAFDGRGAGAASHGTRDLGGQIPPQARRLTIRFEPAEGWTPPEPWRRMIEIDLRERRLLD
jgi:hypothetical protein